MDLSKPTYLIAELEGDVVALVNEMRKRFNPKNQYWPVDITIAGSSGIGTIKQGQDLSAVIGELAPIIEKLYFTEVSFVGVENFPNTGIYYLKPDRQQFDQMHEAVAESGIEFGENCWPYNPHCSLCISKNDSPKHQEFFSSIQIPDRSSVNCFSLYQPESNGGNRVYRF